MKAEHPTAPPVRTRDRRAQRRDAVGTRIADHCDDLNAWMQRHQIDEHNGQPFKPASSTAPELAGLIDLLTSERLPAWLRATADLLSLSGKAQTDLGRTIKNRARASRRDGDYHDAQLNFAGMWGHPSVFLATRPRNVDPQAAQARLETYMRAKRYQLRSDRAYGYLFDEDANLEQVLYINDPIIDDPQLEALIERLGLKPVGDKSPGPIPPSARRATRRLRGKRSKPKKR